MYLRTCITFVQLSITHYITLFMEEQLFETIPHLRVMICRQCRYGVWPAEVESHLKHQHQLNYQTVRQMVQAIHQWPGLASNYQDVQIPRVLDEPLPIVPCHSNGMLCRRDPSTCQYLVSSLKLMRNHWRLAHQWSQHANPGRAAASLEAVPDISIQEGFERVSYQKLFPTRAGSHYIHIRFPNGRQFPAPAPGQAQQAVDAVIRAWEETECKQAQTPIQRELIIDANPWLRMTQWAVYLQGIHPCDVLRSVAPPDPTGMTQGLQQTASWDVDASDSEASPLQLRQRARCPSAEISDPVEKAIQTLWWTVDQVVRKSQRTVQHCGVAIRMEAARTQQTELPYRPLLGYMDEDSIMKRVYPWQQVLTFFARTQMPHSWASPPYDFTPRQRQRWCALWQAVQVDDVEEAIDDEQRLWLMTRRERACLEFCVELLNQRQRSHEYESALVCAMAVLGRSEDGWRTCDSYPPILSSVIKIARFFVVQKALWLDRAAPQIIALWQKRRTDIPWALTSADDALEDLDQVYISVSASCSSSPSPRQQQLMQQVHRSLPPTNDYNSVGCGWDPDRSRAASLLEPSSEGFTSPVHPLRSTPARSPLASSLRMSGHRTFQENVERMVQSFMVRGTHGPMQTLLDWRTYGLKVHYNSTTPGYVAWIGADEVLYKDIQFTMGGFRGFVHGLTGATKDILHRLLYTENPPAIPWQKLYDDAVQDTPGWSFLRDSRTPWPVEGRRWLIDRVRDDPHLQREFIRTDHFHPAKVQTYLQRVARFKEKLAVLIHVVAGQPARIPELLSLQHVNTDQNRRRNVYIEDGMVALVSAYHKGFYANNDTKIIHRYLPQEVGELLVHYLWLVLPFIQQLEAAGILPPGEQPCADKIPRSTASFLWGPDPGTGRKWSSDRFRQVLKRETQTRLSRQGITIPAYRDLAVGISRRFLRPNSQFRHNQQEERETELAGIDADDEDHMDAAQWMGHIADLQAAHSSHVAGLVYGRQVMEAAGTTAHRQALFRASSTDWHRFLGFASAQAPELPSMLGRRKQAPWEEAAKAHQVWRQHRLQQADMMQAAREMTGQVDLQLRGVQGAALRAIQDGESPVVAVMPTGGGKSMLFMLPAWLEPGGTTIVVVPLLSLRQDLQRRCQQLGIACVAWDSRCPPDDASIVFVTPESSEHPDFHSFMNRLRVQQRLDRIVVDECHVVLDDPSGFRPAMRRLGHLTSAKTQMLYLTATLPPSEEERFFGRIQHEPDSVRMIRGSTRRQNIRYWVWRPEVPVQVGRGPHEWIALEAVQQYLRRQVQLARPGKVVVYAGIVSQVQALAQALGCPAYHSQQVNRAGVLQGFIDGITPVLVATSALGMGVDVPDIRCVIHVGMPRTLLDYAQESGRAGRDGLDSRAILIQPAGWDDAGGWMGAVVPGEEERMQAYLKADCRRQVLDKYLDGAMDGDSPPLACREDAVEDGAAHAAALSCDQCEPWAMWSEPTLLTARSTSPCAHGGGDGGEAPRDRFPAGSPMQRARGASILSPGPVGMAGASAGGQASGMEQAGLMERRHRWGAADLQVRQQMIPRRLTEEQVAEDAGQWQDQCYICTMQGRDGSGHDLYLCRQGDSQRAKAWMVWMRRRIRYAAFQSCYVCGMPQSICIGWQQPRLCGYRGILIPMVAAMVYGPWQEAVLEAWQARLQQQQIDIHNQEAVAVYLGQVGLPGHGRLFDEYCWLRDICQPLEASRNRGAGLHS